MKSKQKRRLKIYSAMALGLTVVPLVESVTNTAIVAYAANRHPALDKYYQEQSSQRPRTMDYFKTNPNDITLSSVSVNGRQGGQNRVNGHGEIVDLKLNFKLSPNAEVGKLYFISFGSDGQYLNGRNGEQPLIPLPSGDIYADTPDGKVKIGEASAPWSAIGTDGPNDGANSIPEGGTIVVFNENIKKYDNIHFSIEKSGESTYVTSEDQKRVVLPYQVKVNGVAKGSAVNITRDTDKLWTNDGSSFTYGELSYEKALIGLSVNPGYKFSRQGQNYHFQVDLPNDFEFQSNQGVTPPENARHALNFKFDYVDAYKYGDRSFKDVFNISNVQVSNNRRRLTWDVTIKKDISRDMNKHLWTYYFDIPNVKIKSLDRARKDTSKMLLHLNQPINVNITEAGSQIFNGTVDALKYSDDALKGFGTLSEPERPTYTDKSREEKEPIPFKTHYRFNKDLKGNEVKEVQPGITGERKRTITWEEDSSGNRRNERTGNWQVTKQKQDRIVEYGIDHPPVPNVRDKNTPIPYNTIRIEDPSLPKGVEKVVQNGEEGLKRRVEQQFPPSPEWVLQWEGIVKEKVDKIIHYGIPHPPKIWGVHQTQISDGERLNLLHGIEAEDMEDGNLSDKVTVEGEVDYTKDGSYPVTYKVTDSDGMTDTVVSNVIVKRFPAEAMIKDLQNKFNDLQNNINKLPDEVRAKVNDRLKPQLDGINESIKALEKTDPIQRQQADDLIKRMGEIEGNINDLKAEDQRLANDLGDVEKSYEGLKDTVKQLGDQITNHYDRLQSLEARLRRAEEHTTKTMSRVDKLYERLDGFERDLKGIDNRYQGIFKELKEAISNNRKSLDGYQDTLKGLGNDLAKNTDNLDQIKKTLDEMDTHLDGIQKSVDQQDQQVNDLKERVDQLNKGILEETEKLTRLEEQSKGLGKVFDQLDDQANKDNESLKESIQKNQEDIGQLKDRLQALEAKTQSNEEDLTNSEKELNDLKEKSTQLDQDTAKQNDQLQELLKKVEKSEDSLSSVRDQLNQQRGKVDQLENNIKLLDNQFDSKKEGLLDQIGKVKDQLNEVEKLVDQGEKDVDQQDKDHEGQKARIEKAKELLLSSQQILDDQEKHLEALESSFKNSGKAINQVTDRIDQLNNKKDEIRKVLDHVENDPSGEELSSLVHKTTEGIESLKEESDQLKDLSNQGTKKSEKMHKVIDNIDKIVKDMTNNLSGYMESHGNMEERTDSAGEKIENAKSVLIQLQEELKSIEQNNQAAKGSLEKLEATEETIEKETSEPGIIEKVINTLTKPFKQSKETSKTDNESLITKEDSNNNDQTNSLDNNTQNNELSKDDSAKSQLAADAEALQEDSSSKEEKTDKDKSLDRSKESKELPEAGMTSLGSIIGLAGAALSSVAGFIFYKNNKKK
ncbi:MULTISPECIES: G5 domain-containing protein [Aerococcus]|uniref:G5 domain-containing protein n=1 Tax=Aerococcus TaxID=1375 RepID=UPI0018A7A5B1|nr:MULTISPECIES: G5 domain-containing protein [Aerococcus]MCY3067585.1 G5 domain-containing protein [Aerococcus mictus]MCY3080880.1 G5 domain-containing protein [Aerococcus mictus]MDK8485485.1 G5 domain-containing protein [Aerococcus urinae]